MSFKISVGHPLFFLQLALSNRPKFLAFSKKKSYDVLKPFFTWNNSFNVKDEHSNSIEENRNILYSILCIFLIQICEFQCSPGVSRPPIMRRLVFFYYYYYYYFSIWLTDPISGNAYDTKRKKKEGWPY